MSNVHVKICGITRAQDAELVIELGGWAIGFVLSPNSVRACPPEVAAGISRIARRRIELVGVFVNAPLSDVVAAADTLVLTHIQLHGDEGPAYCTELAHRTGCKVIKAFRISSGSVVHELGRFRTDFHLLDGPSGNIEGEEVSGSERTWDWNVAKRLATSDVPVLLSGGLTAENVAEGIAAVNPWGVDTAYGVESEPGIIDHDKLVRFFAATAPLTIIREEGDRERPSESPLI